jgi:DMSO/TMAO reductase YedYZ molybdopterin-dependent catalytic subunit
VKRSTVISGILVGAVTSALAVAVLAFCHAAWDLPFAPFDIFEWISRALPGSIVTTGIDAMVSAIGALGIHPTSVAAKIAEQSLAIGMFVAGSAVLGAVIAVLGRRSIVLGLVAGGFWVTCASLARAELGVLTPGAFACLVVALEGWGALAGVLLVHDASVPVESRRKFLAAIAIGTAVLVGITTLVRRRVRIGGGQTPEPPVRSLSPVRGTRPEITPNDRFYRVDINLEPAHVDARSWRLAIGGLVDRPLSLTLDELRAMTAVAQPITLECISNPVGGDLIGTSVWTGVPLREVLDRAGVSARARFVRFAAADGFYECASMNDVDDPRTLLVYAMNHAPLADSHGFPLRLYIPDRHGMKLPKWITQIEVVDHDTSGYWVDRGWSATAIPHTTSVIDVVDGASIGGIAYAGARGIRKVEVQVDGGPWLEAELLAPPVSPLCWVLWRVQWPYAPGRHTFAVRATDGTGAVQTAVQRPPHPDGATGLHTLVKTVS